MYTPTKNVVFHDYGDQANGHGNNEWFKRARDRFRKSSIARAKTILNIPGGETESKSHANKGIYGLGQRRTLEQLAQFCNVDFANGKGNVGPNAHCSSHKYVTFDDSIPPTANLYENPDNLDPQPLYPLRDQLIFYKPMDELSPAYPELEMYEANSESDRVDEFETTTTATTPAAGPSTSVLLVLWVFGLIVWCVMFQSPGGKPNRRRKALNHKDV